MIYERKIYTKFESYWILFWLIMAEYGILTELCNYVSPEDDKAFEL